MAKAARSQVAGLSPWLRRAVWLLLGLHVAGAAYVLWRSAVLTPYSDELDWIARWYALRETGDWASYLLTPVNFHRIPLTFGLIAADIQLLGGSNLPLIASGALGLALMAVLFGRSAAQAAPAVMKLPATALAVMLTLLASSVLDAATPICVDYVHGAALAVAALVTAAGADRRDLLWRGPLALLLAAAAGLGDGAALAVWPVLAIDAARRRSWGWLGAVLIAAVGYLGFYLYGQVGGAGGAAGAAAGNILDAMQLALGYLTLPGARLLRGWAWIGGAMVAVLAAAALLLKGGRFASPLERKACALILFTLGTAAMMALGRTALTDPTNVPVRYAILVTPMHVGLLMLALPWAGDLWRANRVAAQGVIAVALALVTVFDVVMANAVIRASDAERETIARFKAGERVPAMLVLVHPAEDRAKAMYERFERDGLFQHELHLDR